MCDVPVAFFSASWGANGKILFSTKGQFNAVSASGGAPISIKLTNNLESAKRNPQLLADGDHFLYDNVNQGQIEIASLSSGSGKVVLENASEPHYSGGYLLFSRDGKIFAQAFDAAMGKISGPAIALINDANYSVAGSVRAYHPHSPFGRMEWYDLTGEARGTVGSDSRVLGPRISPDGKRVLYTGASLDNQNRGYSVMPLQGGVANRLTFGGDRHWPTWSPDGKYIAYASDGDGKVVIGRKLADGSSEEETLLTLPPEYQYGSTVDWSPDGRYLSYDCYNTKENHWEMWILPLFADRKPFRPVPSNSESQYDGNFSRDGHWLAYFADNGRPDVYVTSFPGPGGKYQISSAGGFDVAWDRLNHLFYLTTGNTLVQADLELSAQSLQVKAIHRMFQLPLPDVAARLFDVTADGQRILVVTPTDPEANSIGLLLNWQAELKK